MLFWFHSVHHTEYHTIYPISWHQRTVNREKGFSKYTARTLAFPGHLLEGCFPFLLLSAVGKMPQTKKQNLGSQ